MNEQKKTLVLIDGNALIHRSYHALPPLTTKKGEVVHAVYGFTSTLLSVLEKFHPEYIAASFDLPGGTFRDELYAEYKATRTKAPDDLYAQIPRVKEVVSAMNIPIYELAGFEADDCVGSIAKQAGAQGVVRIRLRIVLPDRLV
jgi:DNA polymerase-1